VQRIVRAGRVEHLARRAIRVAHPAAHEALEPVHAKRSRFDNGLEVDPHARRVEHLSKPSGRESGEHLLERLGLPRVVPAVVPTDHRADRARLDHREHRQQVVQRHHRVWSRCQVQALASGQRREHPSQHRTDIEIIRLHHDFRQGLGSRAGRL